MITVSAYYFSIVDLQRISYDASRTIPSWSHPYYETSQRDHVPLQMNFGHWIDHGLVCVHYPPNLPYNLLMTSIIAFSIYNFLSSSLMMTVASTTCLVGPN